MSKTMTLPELINAYWDCAYAEGKDGIVSADAQRIRSAIDDLLTERAQVDAKPCAYCGAVEPVEWVPPAPNKEGE